MDKNSRNLMNQLEKWYSTVDFSKFAEEIEKSIIGQEEVRLVLANVYNYIGNIVEERPVNNNMILCAPSGSGKTETYRALKDYFAEHIPYLPIYIIDVSQLTAAGFRGMDPADILGPFYAMHMEDAIGICFLDEFDKKLVSLKNSDESDINREAQSNILTIVEGADVLNKSGEIVNTSNVMFVALGSFDAFRAKREVVTKHIGFGAENEEKEVEHYAPVSAEDMVKFGGTNELIGRFPVIVNYSKLNDEAIRKVIDKVAVEICDSFDCELQLSEDMIKDLYAEADSKFGCRAFQAILRNIVLRTYTRALCQKNNDRLVINVINKNKGEFTWRKYTDDEKYSMTAFRDTMDRYRNESMHVESVNKKVKNTEPYEAIEDILRKNI